VAILVVVSLVTRARHRAHAVPFASHAVHLAEEGEGLPILGDVPSFAFTNIDGRSIDASALRGHVWIADFIFTRCVTMCPIITARMNVLRRSIRSSEIRFVSFSIEPEYDTPAVLRAYAARWSADPRWLLLSPPVGKETEFAKAMNMPFQRTAMPLEPILHSTQFFLIDQRGRVRGLYGSLDDAAVRRLVADATRLDAASDIPRDSSRQNDEQAPLSGASRGHTLFQALGCEGCHSNPKTGPALAGLAGRTVRLEGGTAAVADASYLRRSILAPTEQVVLGYNPLMPAYDGYLAPPDVDDLVAYVRSIPPAAGSADSEPVRGSAKTESDADVQDPVCGMTMKKMQAAAHADRGGKTYYFCSERCRSRFLRDVGRYATRDRHDMDDRRGVQPPIR
jgi:protein SCO1/2